LLKRFCGVKLLVHSHNAEGMRWKSLGKWWWRIMDSYEGWTLRRADYNFFMTGEDKAYAISRFRLRPATCITIPVGIERPGPPAVEEMRPAAKTLHEKYQVPAEEPLLFFNGAFRYKPNREALENLLFRVNPILQEKGFAYRLLICGLDIPQSFLQQSFPGVELAGFAEDLELYLKGTDVFLNPVLTGGGIKTKLVEALGFNLDAVSTQSGAAGVDPGICNGKLIICADGDWQAFARAIMEHAVKQKDTPPAFYEQFYWGNIAKKAAEFIKAGEGGRL
jgi:glycosyltransferase involved in cell wall biosynthesis